MQCCGGLVGQPPKQDASLPEATPDFKPSVLHTRVPGRFGSKLSTRMALVVGFGDAPTALRTRQSTVIGLTGTPTQSWVLKAHGVSTVALHRGPMCCSLQSSLDPPSQMDSVPHPRCQGRHWGRLGMEGGWQVCHQRLCSSF